VSPSAPPLPAPGIGIPNFQKVITALVGAATALVVLGNATAKADPFDPYGPGPGPVLPLPCGNGFNCGPMGRPNLPPPPPGGGHMVATATASQRTPIALVREMVLGAALVRRLKATHPCGGMAGPSVNPKTTS
jgi:hypothetical protein